MSLIRDNCPDTDAWVTALDHIQARLPAALTWVGGGLVVLEVLSENPQHWAWLGVGKTEDADGPWVEGAAAGASGTEFDWPWVGGYAYAGPDGSKMSEAVMLPVPHPTDPHSVADTLIDAARELLALPCEVWV